MAGRLEVVDAHHHLWDLALPFKYPWLNGPNPVQVHVAGPLDPIRRTYDLSEYLHEGGEQVKVIKSVHVQADAADDLGEAEWLQGIADKHGYPHGIVCGIHLHEEEAKVQALLAKYAALKNVRGVRQLLNFSDTKPLLCLTDANHLANPAWERGYALLAAHPFSFDLHCLPHQAAQAVSIIQRHPRTPVIVDHCGLDPERTPESFRAWREAIRRYASLPFAWMKMSGLGMFDHAWTEESIAPYISACIEEFGVERCFFASNFPVDKLLSSYPRLWLAFDAVTVRLGLTEQQRKALFVTNAQRAYRL